MNKLKQDPYLFFKDAFKNKYGIIDRVFSNFKPKKYQAYNKYAIVSAVYNVEKYLDDFFKSIINQRLDFKNNIYLICVDDGSTDNSVQIIKKYQKKYPKNIIYLYKENGGQASARNLGLKYLKENDLNTPWITFTDPDDFLDRNYFYEVDKNIKKHNNDDICMIGCNLIYFYEAKNIYRDNHPLRFKFTQGNKLVKNASLGKQLQLSVASCFLNFIFLKKMDHFYFDEKLIDFEDNKLIFYFLEGLKDYSSVFLSSAKYYYRKREDGNSTLDKGSKLKSSYLTTLKIGTLDILINGKMKDYARNNCLYHLIWQIRSLINHPEKLSFMTLEEKQDYLKLLDKNFSYIDIQTILDFDLADCWFFYKIGILNCFKKEKPCSQIVYIQDYDPYQEQILLVYYTGDDKEVESIRFDGKEIYADYEKIVQYDFLDRVFCYEKRFWVQIPKYAENLEVWIDNKMADIFFADKWYSKFILKIIQETRVKSIFKLWLLMDRDIYADDNAEHFYRYIMHNHPEQEIIFALKKESPDWERLKNEGFNLIEFGSCEFKKLIKRCSKIISSHIDDYIMSYLKDNQQFIFLPHGITKDDFSYWYNLKKINLFITSTQDEYNSIAGDYNHYKFTKKEVVLTGFPRHDIFLKNNKIDSKQILIMPTWRSSIVGETISKTSIRRKNAFFKQTNYYKMWNCLLQNQSLKKLCNDYNYSVIFNPHPNIIPYLEDFDIPSWIEVVDRNQITIQDLFKNVALLVTDYSSVAFEAAYLEKPVIYYQFDKKEVFNGIHTYHKGYFDYEKYGFGSVVETEKELLNELEKILKNGCKVDRLYKSNMKNTFVYKDGKCCERIYKKILEMNEIIKIKITREQMLRKIQSAIEKKCYFEIQSRLEYFLSNFRVTDDSFVLNYLKFSRKNHKQRDAIDFIGKVFNDYKKFSCDIKMELIKNYITENNYLEALNLVELIKIDEEKKYLIKLKIYLYFNLKEEFKSLYCFIKSNTNIDLNEIERELMFFQVSIVRAFNVDHLDFTDFFEK
ncbi:TPA: CDP-glycerol:glycerophosphate glycerophosphotransferase [Campylobacter jejuni]